MELIENLSIDEKAGEETDGVMDEPTMILRRSKSEANEAEELEKNKEQPDPKPAGLRERMRAFFGKKKNKDNSENNKKEKK